MRKLILGSFITTAAFTAATFFSAPVFAQPDISGYWMISFGPVPPGRPADALEQEMIDTLPPGTKLLADSGLVEFPPGEFGGLELTEAAKQEVANYDMSVQVNLDSTCQPPSIIYSMQGPFPMEIFQGTEMIVIKMEYFDVVRIVFMNETEHPDDWPHSVTGHSIGRWEGDTLVVDTAFIQSSTMMNNGLDHSDDLKLTERFRLSPDGKRLVFTQEFEDPAVFAGRAARIVPLDKGEGHVYPYACDPSYGMAIEGRERQ
ncbi:MAG: hypothetical protein SV422_11455 [Pseudomonadota bacterium]|nr:hypothetical protein [Pseudomonadota bacterium]